MILLEKRKIEELKQVIIRLYAERGVENLLKYISLRGDGWHKVSSEAPAETPITYCSGKENEHNIEIRIPGIRTFLKEKGSIEKNICSYDFRICLSNNKNNKGLTPIKHTDIVKYLYEIVARIENPKQRGKKYEELKQILTNVYNDNEIFQYPFNEIIEYGKKYEGNLSLVEIITFIKWCSAQEELNFSGNRAWGKDLSFARYFEAIYYAQFKNENGLKKVLKNTENKEKGIPSLHKNPEIYGGCLNHRYTDK